MKLWKFLKQKLSGKTLDKNRNTCYNKSVEKNNEGVVNLEHLQAVIKKYQGKKFTVKNDKIKQTERNEFKHDLSNAIALDLQDAGLEIGQVDKGYAVLVPNDELGAVAITINAVVKSLDYNFNFEVEREAEHQVEVAKRLAERKESKAKG